MTNCFVYESASTCSMCQDGTFFDIDNNKCLILNEAIRSTCLMAWNSTTKCDVCTGRKLSTNGSCNTINTCTDPNCDSCYWNTERKEQHCYYCKSRYILQSSGAEGTTCLKTTGDNMVGCYSSLNAGVCMNCNVGYFFGDKSCLKTALTEFAPLTANSVSILLINLISLLFLIK